MAQGAAWGILPERGWNLCLLHWQADFFFFFLTTEPPGKHTDVLNEKKFMREEG